MIKKIIISLIAVLVLGFGYIYFISDDNYNLTSFPEDSKENMSRTKVQPKEEVMVYETEAENGDECSSYEYFDPEAKVCYYECQDSAECNNIQKEIDSELSQWADETEADKEPISEKAGESEQDLTVEYNVKSGETLVFKTGQEKEEYRKIWTEIADLSPDKMSDEYIETFGIFSDAKSDTLAYVDDQDNNGKWRVVVNIAAHKESSLREQKATIIHELGHILTLNRGQLSTNESCQNLALEEGCANQGSYLNTFYNKFWKGFKAEAKAEFDADKFVTEYAASNVTEDAAESWAFFVMDKDAENLGDSKKEQKIKHFYSFPELVSIRQDMRKVLGREIVRAKKLTQNK